MVGETLASQPFSVGGTIGKVFGTVFKNIVPFLTLTLIVYVPILAVYIWLVPSDIVATDEISISLTAFAGGLVFTVANAIIAAFLAEAARSVTIGQRQSVLGYVTAVLPRMPAVIVAFILSVLIVVVGMLLLVIPGIIAVMILFVTIPACVIERLGPVQALKRSRELTKGYRWPLLGFYLILVLINVPFALLAEFGMETVNATLGMEYLAELGLGAGQILLNVFYAMFGGVATAVAYMRLRELKGGPDPEQLATIFD